MTIHFYQSNATTPHLQVFSNNTDIIYNFFSGLTFIFVYSIALCGDSVCAENSLSQRQDN